MNARINRSEYDAIKAALDVQFKRIAQIQAELDELKRAWVKHKSSI